MPLPLSLIGPAVAIGKGIASGIKSLGGKKTAMKSVVNKGKEQVKTKISPIILHSISPRYNEKPKEVCPKCNKKGLKKQISAPSFRHKGGGTYETD